MLTRLIDYLKSEGVTGLFTALTPIAAEAQSSPVGVSSLMDTWILLQNVTSNGERNRGLYVLKSRGMAHSNQIREFILSPNGIKLREAYVGPAGVLTGSARLAQEARDKAEALTREQEMQRRSRNLERKRREISAQIEVLQAQLAREVDEDALLNREDVVREDQLATDRAAIAKSRHVAATPGPKPASMQKSRLEKP